LVNITIDPHGLVIEGAPALIQAGALHYFRLPHLDLWRPVLVRMRVAGFNAVVVPFPWAYHSPAPGFYDFTGPRDIRQLLDEAERAGLWLIPYVGPWLGLGLDSGGMPAWVQRPASGIAGSAGPGHTPAASLLRHVADWWKQLFPKFQRRENLLAVAVNPGPGVRIGDLPGYARWLVDLVRAESPGAPCVVPESVYAAMVEPDADDSPSHVSALLTWSGSGLQDLSQTSIGDSVPRSFAMLDPTVSAAWIGVRRKSAREHAGGDHPRGLVAAAMAARRSAYVLSPVHEGINWGWWGTAGLLSRQGYGAPVSAWSVPPEAYYSARRMALTLETLGGILVPPTNPPTAPGTPDPSTMDGTAEGSAEAGPGLTTVPPEVLLGEQHGPTGTAAFLLGMQGSEDLVHLALGSGDDARLVEDIPLGQGEVRVLPVDWQLSECLLLTTTMEPVLRTTVAGRELLILLNGSGGEVLLSSDLRIRHQRGPVYVERTAQGIAVHFDPARIASLVLDGPERGTVQLLALDSRMAARVWPLDDAWRTTPFFPAAWTPTDEEPARGVVVGPDLVVPEDDGSFRVLAADQGFGYRWGPWRGSDPHTWLSPFTWRGARPVSLPPLVWSSCPGAPEVLPAYDDQSWRAGVPGMPLTMETLGVDYGFVWYRGYFDVAASSVTVACRHACDLFLNGHHIAALSPRPDFGAVLPKTLPLPERYLRQDNVLALLVENQGRPASWDPEAASHGLISCGLDTTTFTQWRVRGGLTGEVRRQGFCGFADWSSIEPGGAADITWHRSTFDLSLPSEVEVRMVLILDETPTKCYIYLNGQLIGRMWYPQETERRFWLPDGVLRRRGSNELLIAQWTRGAEPGIGLARLEDESVAAWHRVDAT